MVAGAFLVVAYNLELFGGRFHNDLWFALAWGAFPALTGFWVNALRAPARRRPRGGRVLPAERRAAAAEHARRATCAGAPSRCTASSTCATAAASS